MPPERQPDDHERHRNPREEVERPPGEGVHRAGEVPCDHHAYDQIRRAQAEACNDELADCECYFRDFARDVAEARGDATEPAGGGGGGS